MATVTHADPSVGTDEQTSPVGTRPEDQVFTERYRAIAARDTRFDGQFITAVRSTGIYCRPSCPARTPKSENVVFYLTSAAAHEAGFRACKRCLPEAAPGTPEWDLRRDVAGRAMRLLADGIVDREGVGGLATRLGYSPRQVQRVLVAELGAGPLALARAQRAQTARALVIGTDLSLADIAFAAGFGSIRQFNDTMSEIFGATPGGLRTRRRPVVGRDVGGPDDGGRGPGTPATVRLSLPVREPFDARAILEFLAVRAVDGVETADLAGPPLRYARTVALPHGPGAFEVTGNPGARPGAWRLDLRLELSALADVAVAVARVRRLLDLDTDPAAVDAALATDPALAPLVAARPGTRVPGAVDAHETVLRAIVGQQVSVAAARTHLSRLASTGTPYASGIPGLTRLFPTPSQVADHGDEHLRLPARSIRTVRDTARALADGDLEVDVGRDPSALREALVERPGIGPWTAAYVAMRVLGDPDAWLDGDVALLAGARELGLLEDGPRSRQSRALSAHAAGWAPWRSYAAVHLWRIAARPPIHSPTGARP
ncbi:DNA-3-methyladenine glycosylase 2 family protein [Georgenia halophila]|uniref:DNA-3-methyladenine glycosylase II n=1 Tax=Georgenia halophila TaxID=620889 RepID=A0ABP8KTX5_9MICO